jgi:peptidoglycan/xylan/chitin deacetylase (PgdA/CDA1 family)
MDRLAIAERFLAAFRRHGLRSVYGFVNGKRVADDPSAEAILIRWKEAGHPLGNHTYSHVSLNAVGLSDYFADLERGEEILKRLQSDAGVWKVFRHPFLYEGDTSEKREGVRGYLREHGYATAPVTIDADDWAFNPPFSRCTAQHDAASLAKLRRAFIEVHTDELRRMRALTRTLMQREVRQILLLHIGAADADSIEDLLTAYEMQGVKWIDLRTALADAMYGLDPGDVARYGAAFPYRLAKARGISVGAPVFARDLEDELSRTCPAPR